MAFTYQGNILGSTSASLYNIQNITGSQTILRESPTRSGFIISNDSNKDLYVSYDTICSVNGVGSRFTFVIHSHSINSATTNNYIATPPIWAGPISFTYLSEPTTGSSNITELF